jgi:uncharacterized alpha-E superfamily protein
MLSRVADSIYWMGRYVERAENVARFIDVNLKLMLDNPDPAGGAQWEPLVSITGDDEPFKKRYGEATQDSVLKFLTFDEENPNSILSCLRSARWNARSVREIISSEMWLQLNKFYLMVNSAASDPKPISLDEFFADVKNCSHLFQGVTDATMTHGEAWHFCRLARELERADKTSRMVDVKYFILLRSVEDVGTALDDLQWAAVLRSISAFHMYRRDRGRVTPKGVVDYLLLDRYFPRAIHHCLLSGQESLHAISGTPHGAYKNRAEKLLGQLCSDLSYAGVDEIINGGLHEYLDDLQLKMNQVSASIYETFFALKTPANLPKAGGMSQRQSQTQTQLQ